MHAAIKRPTSHNQSQPDHPHSQPRHNSMLAQLINSLLNLIFPCLVPTWREGGGGGGGGGKGGGEGEGEAVTDVGRCGIEGDCGGGRGHRVRRLERGVKAHRE